MREELETRERRATEERSEEATARSRLKAELERLRQRAADEQRRAAEAAAAAAAAAAGPSGQQEPGGGGAEMAEQLARTLKVTWDAAAGDYGSDALRTALGAHGGRVEAVVLRQRKRASRGSALVVMATRCGAAAAPPRCAAAAARPPVPCRCSGAAAATFLPPLALFQAISTLALLHLPLPLAPQGRRAARSAVGVRQPHEPAAGGAAKPGGAAGRAAAARVGARRTGGGGGGAAAAAPAVAAAGIPRCRIAAGDATVSRRRAAAGRQQ